MFFKEEEYQNAGDEGYPLSPLVLYFKSWGAKKTMINIDSKFKKLKWEFYLFRDKLSLIHQINMVLTMARKQIWNVFTINGERKGTGDELLYRSIIYTLFYANFMSVALVVNQERFEFDYVDTKLIIRAIIERCITQKFILTDPQRLANLFLYWGRIEAKRFHNSREKVKQSTLPSLALDIDFEGALDEWSTEREAVYQEHVTKWESLVQPKQEAAKAKSWSGYSLAEMAKLTGLEDIYKLTYREASWYSHGLISVPDFYLKVTENRLEYSSSASNLQKIECYTQTEKLFLLSFSCTNEALGWNLAQEIEKIENESFSTFGWVWEFIKLC